MASPPTPAVDLLQDAALSAFRASGLVVVVRCAVLGDEVVWAADGTPEANRGMDDQGRVVYHGEELLLLLAMSSRPEDLRAYHRLRKGAGRGGGLVSFTKPETQRPGAAA